MSMDERPTLLAVRNVPWETPHRILDSCGELEVRQVCPLEGDPLPSHEEVAGALVMGGPMNVDETDRYPPRGDARLAGRGGEPRDAGAGDLPRRAAAGAGARRLAFRLGDAWGVLFHPEADLALAEHWMSTAAMSSEAVAALGAEAAGRIIPEAAELEAGLIAATRPGFEAFAALVADAGSR